MRPFIVSGHQSIRLHQRPHVRWHPIFDFGGHLAAQMHDGLYRFHLHAGAHKLQAANGGALHVGQKALDRAAPVSSLTVS